MKTKTWAVCLACMAIGFVLAALTQLPGQEKAGNPARVRWEYTTRLDPTDAKLNELGKEGWDLLPSPRGDQTNWCYFKRPAP